VAPVRARARPQGAASRARNPGPASPSAATKGGFTKPNKLHYAVVNLGQLQKCIDAGTLDAKAEITEDVLVAAGIVRRKLDGVRVLAKGEIAAKVKLAVTGASQAAIDAVTKAGGSLSVKSPAAAE
jgi:large subunit ribosomal protein L15